MSDGPAIPAIPASADRWCILRCNGSSTVRLAAALQAGGFDAWTPVERIVRREPRGKAKDRMTVAMTPTYVFASARHLADLRALERAEVSTYPRFSIFRYYHETVFVRHAALHALRAQEQDSYVASLPTTGRHYTKAHGTPFDAGSTVTFKGGALAGLPCVVEASDGRITHLTLTMFGRVSTVKIETSDLRQDGVATS